MLKVWVERPLAFLEGVKPFRLSNCALLVMLMQRTRTGVEMERSRSNKVVSPELTNSWKPSAPRRATVINTATQNPRIHLSEPMVVRRYARPSLLKLIRRVWGKSELQASCKK